MKPLRLTVISCLLVTILSTMSLIQFQDKEQVDAEKLSCLRKMGLLEEIFIEAYYDTQKLQVSVDFDLLRKQNINPHIIIFPFFYQYYNPDKSAARWASLLKNSNFKTLYVEIDTSDGYKIDCIQLWQYILSLKKYLGTGIGIFMDQKEWGPASMLNVDTCYKLSMLPLFYRDVKPFTPFGAWEYYALKVARSLDDKCGVEQIYEVIAN